MPYEEVFIKHDTDRINHGVCVHRDRMPFADAREYIFI